MASYRCEIKLDCAKIIDKLGTLAVKSEMALLMYGQTKASELQSYMKQNRPWTDRTGMAKATLSGKAESIGTGIRITLSHGVDYGIYLEKAHEQRYAIIEPTIRIKGPDVMDGASGLFNKINL